MLKVIEEIIKGPQNIKKLCEEVKSHANETVASVKKNGVILDKIK